VHDFSVHIFWKSRVPALSEKKFKRSAMPSRCSMIVNLQFAVFCLLTSPLQTACLGKAQVCLSPRGFDMIATYMSDSSSNSASVAQPEIDSAEPAPESNFDPLLHGIRMKLSSDPLSCIEDLSRVLRDSPNNADALQLIAVAHENVNQLEIAKEYLNKAIEVGSGAFIRDRRLHCHLAQLQRFELCMIFPFDKADASTCT
jgi:hypothetical protein